MTKCMEKCKKEAIIFYEVHFDWEFAKIGYVSYCKSHSMIYQDKDWMKPITKDEFLASVILES